MSLVSLEHTSAEFTLTKHLKQTLNQKRNLIYFFLLEDEQGADYDDNDLLDALADIVIDRQEKVLYCHIIFILAN